MFRVVLDPGHGQFNNPGHVKGYYEGTQMFKLAYFQKELLEQYEDVEVVVTRQLVTDNPSLQERGEMAKGFDLFYSDHSNAPGSTALTAVHGVAVYDSVFTPNVPFASVMAEAVADAMGSYVRGKTSTNPTGVQHRHSQSRPGYDYYGVLRNAAAVGCPTCILMEHGFHTNPEECEWLMSDANLKKLAEYEIRAIAQFFNFKKKGESNMIYCKRGDGSKENPDDNVKAMQTAFLRLGYKMINDDVEYEADGSYGQATANAVLNYKKAKAVDGDGDTFDDVCLTFMLVDLELKASMSTIEIEQAEARVLQAENAFNTLEDAFEKQSMELAEVGGTLSEFVDAYNLMQEIADSYKM